MATKFIFVTGGVLSSLGKGVTAASIGVLLESTGNNIILQKLDPYVNVDPGTMNPFQHGEVFVTDDGAETDLDLGHYERFTSTKMNKSCNHTTGSIYYNVIMNERNGDYLGNTIQIIPHITDEIKRVILSASDSVDLCIVEIGGTVGDIESLPFLESIRQFKSYIGDNNVVYVHLTLIPYVDGSGELKTKPTQHSVMELRRVGIQPDIILCRTQRHLPRKLKEKISLFCNVEYKSVITVMDVPTIYELPLHLHEQGVDDRINKKLELRRDVKQSLNNWKDLVRRIKNTSYSVTIAMVGKYTALTESYKSVNEALTHGGIANDTKVNILHIDSEQSEYNIIQQIKNVDGILVPGGFGSRGLNGKISAVKFAREENIPYFGICYGMHMALVEFARNILKLHNANSEEVDSLTLYPVIYKMKEWFDFKSNKTKYCSSRFGASMRLGSYPCILKKDTLAIKIYNTNRINERHRHRFEFNNKFRSDFESNGFIISGTSPDDKLVEMMEYKNHPWFLCCQFHPEFKSRPMDPHPIFKDFIMASLTYKNKNK